MRETEIEDDYSFARALARGFVDITPYGVRLNERGAVMLALYQRRHEIQALDLPRIPYIKILAESLRILIVDRHGSAAVHNWINTVRAERARRRGEI